jgi:GxxExxY protein
MINIESYKKHLFDVIGAIHEVHCELGAGLNESCYQEGLQLQLEEQGIPFTREQSFHPLYHNKEMQALYRIDFLCKGDIIVECKSVVELISVHRAQLFNYMRLLKKPCGILVNFAPRNYDLERYFYDEETNNIISVDGKIIYDFKARRPRQYY